MRKLKIRKLPIRDVYICSCFSSTKFLSVLKYKDQKNDRDYKVKHPFSLKKSHFDEICSSKQVFFSLTLVSGGANCMIVSTRISVDLQKAAHFCRTIIIASAIEAVTEAFAPSAPQHELSLEGR